MIRNFDYVEVQFYKWCDEKLESISINRKATTPEELDEIIKEYQEEYANKYFKLIKEGVVKCSCGSFVTCVNFTNTCSCGADYNFNGSLLAPRSQWGEETGEHWTDCY